MLRTIEEVAELEVEEDSDESESCDSPVTSDSAIPKSASSIASKSSIAVKSQALPQSSGKKTKRVMQKSHSLEPSQRDEYLLS